MEEIIKGKMLMDEGNPAKNERPAKPPSPGPPPLMCLVTLSFVDSISSQDGRASAGMVLHREDGSVISAAYRYILHCNEALEAEIHALM